jgi:S1-C subfamily serine protease
VGLGTLLVACAAEPRLESILGTAAPSVVSISDGNASVASAFAVAPGGWLVTSEHVTRGTGALYLLHDDGALHPLERGPSDPDSDIALLRAREMAPPPLILQLHQPQVGETVIALGNPFGLGITATRGIVSALPRSIGQRELLQTDAAVNAGNSGGPLLDRHGRVVGIVTSRGAVGSGIGFAVPAGRIQALLHHALPEHAPVGQ